MEENIKRPYYNLRLPERILNFDTVGELADYGCPNCDRKLYAEASAYFGSLHCSKHGVVWIWIPSGRERRGYAPRAWKNVITGRTSRSWRRRGLGT